MTGQSAGLRPAQFAEWRPCRVVARCFGLGAGLGALFGFLEALTFVVAVRSRTGTTPALAGLVFATPYVLVIGALVGTGCSFGACVVLLLAGESQRAKGLFLADHPALRVRPGGASVAAGIGAPLFPAIGIAFATAGHSRGWMIALTCVWGLALAGGLALGPYVLYGRRYFAASDLRSGGAATYTRLGD